MGNFSKFMQFSLDPFVFMVPNDLKFQYFDFENSDKGYVGN